MTTASDHEILEAVVTAPSISAAARKLGMSRQAVHKRLRKPGLRARVNEVEHAHCVVLRAQLGEGVSEALTVLRDLLHAEEPQVRLAAASRMLTAARVLGLDSATSADRERGLALAVEAEHAARVAARRRDRPGHLCPDPRLAGRTDDEIQDLAYAATSMATSCPPRVRGDSDIAGLAQVIARSPGLTD